MTSFKGKLFNFLLRNRHVFKGKKKKERFDFNSSIAAFRATCEKGANRFGSVPKEISVKEEFIAGIKSEWLIPDGAKPEKLILYVHGGGYVSGSCNDHRGVVSKIAKNTGITNLVYEYRLAPEYPYPAAIDDSVKVYQHLLLLGYMPENIVFTGESAGGGLCLALLLALKEQNIALPKAAVAISPWTDLSCSGESYRTKNKVSLAPLDSWFVFSKHYVGNNNAKHPHISPLFGKLEGLPPIFINAGDADELYDDGVQFYRKAKEAGVDITFRAGVDMVHCYPLLSPFFPEATLAMNEIVDFIRKNLGLN